MAKQQLTDEQRRLDADLWVILLTTLGAFLAYAATSDRLMRYIGDSSLPVLPRLLLNVVVQFGVAGLGITLVLALRKERLTDYGLNGRKAICSILGTLVCFAPVVFCIAASGQFRGYRPFNMLITQDVLASGFPLSVLGYLLIAVVWGFFEGINYVVICEKINRRYPAPGQWLDYGAITCALVCVLFHPMSLSAWGIAELLAMLMAIYGMLIVRKKTGNAWGCIFAFCFVWNAL